jgi:hypothetical protein
LAASAGDKGKRIANRGFTGGKYNGNIEGAEVIYNPDLKNISCLSVTIGCKPNTTLG